MIVVTVARRPLSGSVAQNVLEHGTGALNIDGSRVAAAPGDETTSHVQGKEAANTRHTPHKAWQGIAENYQTSGQKLGRWPANLVLGHLAGCRCAGTRKVKGSPPTAGGMDRFNAANAAQGYRPGAYQKGEVVVGPSRLDEDGNETVDAWECVPGCPVADLDAQSGVVKSGGRVSGMEPSDATGGTTYGRMCRTAGASRFFQQVGGQRG